LSAVPACGPIDETQEIPEDQKPRGHGFEGDPVCHQPLELDAAIVDRHHKKIQLAAPSFVRLDEGSRDAAMDALTRIARGCVPRVHSRCNRRNTHGDNTVPSGRSTGSGLHIPTDFD
jgi:hypothetical protein